MDNDLISEQTKKRMAEISRILSLPYDDLKSEYNRRIAISEFLGNNGWTINGSKTPNNTREWIHRIESSGETAISELFTETEIETILDKLEKQYQCKPEVNYVWKAIDNYHMGRYTESAMFLLCLLDHRLSGIGKTNCRILAKNPHGYRHKTGQCEEGIQLLGELYYGDLENTPSQRLFIVCDYIPSFCAFAKRVFCENEKYDMDKGIEPPYLNRDWLMHGVMTRRVVKHDCIQLINAFNTFLEIEEMLTKEQEDG